MKRITKKDLEQQVNYINDLFEQPVFKLGFRNGFIYIDYIDNSKDALFNNATTTKELYLCLRAFYNGLTFKK